MPGDRLFRTQMKEENMSTLQLFDYSGQRVRTQLIDGEPWFVLADLCIVLGLSAPHMVAKRIAEDDRSSTSVMDSMGRAQQTTIVSESGMYEVVIRSDKPEAVTFRRWLTGDVIPSIRKTGSYSAALARELTFEEKMLEVMGTLNERVDAQRAQLAIAAPKAEAFDTFLSAAGDYDVRDAAQLLHREHGIEIGRTRLFKYLRAHSWIDGGNRPYQYRIDQGLMRIKASTFKFTRTNGEDQLAAPQVRITPKGLDRLRVELKESAA